MDSGDDEPEPCPNTGSRIFQSLKIIGNASSDVPCILRHIHSRKENFITTSIGKSIATFSSTKMKLLTISTSLPEDITCMGADTYHVYTGCGDKIYAWRRGTELKHTYSGHANNVCCILPFAESLISVDRSGLMLMWDIKTEEILGRQQFQTIGFTGLMHPASYTNKILIYSEQGHMHLWNIRKNTSVYYFEGWKSPIIQVAQAPALNIVAIALKNNEVIFHDLKHDLTLFKLKCPEEPISLAFRTDTQNSLLVGSRGGSITVWDLEKREVITYVEHAHGSPVFGLQCFPQEPIFVSSSSDNSVKMWIFDKSDGGFRLLNSREGHTEVPNRIRFHGQKGFNVLSASPDGSFRMFHIHDETQNRCLNKKYKKGSDNVQNHMIRDFTCASQANNTHFDDLAAFHDNKVSLSTWSVHNAKCNKKVLQKPDFSLASPTCIYMTSCGQFVIVGYDIGFVENFNIQSHKHRRSYERHFGTVTGVAASNCNTKVVSAGVFCEIMVSEFKSGQLLHKCVMDAPIEFIVSNRTTDKIAIALQDFTIVIYDIESMDVVRYIEDITDSIADVKFSPSTAWITASSTDCLVRTWDLATGSLIDIFRTEDIVSTLDYSPDGQYLATAQGEQLGIVLWVNKTMFEHVSLLPISRYYKPPVMDSAYVKGFKDPEFDKAYRPGETLFESLDQILNKYITMDLTNQSKWRTCLNINSKNEVKNSTSQPQTYVAPFFINNIIDGATEKHVDIAKPNTDEPPSKIAKMAIQFSPFGTLLMKPEKNEEDYKCIREMLSSKGLAFVEIEIRALSPEGGGSVAALCEFVDFLKEMLKTRLHSEIVQSWVGVFLKVHEATLRREEQLLANLESLFAAQRKIYFSTKQMVTSCQQLSNQILP